MSPASARVVVAESYAQASLDVLRRTCQVERHCNVERAQLLSALADADGLLVRTRTRVDDDLLAAAPRLRVIGRGGVGLDNIDLAAAHRRGVTVVYTPAASTRSVAEHTMGLLIAAEHRFRTGDRAARSSQFEAFRGAVAYRELSDCTLGIIGMGRIGSAVARIAVRGFGMRVCYCDIQPVGPFDFSAQPVDLDALLAEADMVSLHVPLTPATRGMIDATRLAACKPAAILINTARGAVVDAAAVADALAAGCLAAAALDVTEPEPLPPDHPLLCAERVLLTPHLAGRSEAALERMNAVVDDVLRVLQGQPPHFPAPGAGFDEPPNDSRAQSV